MTFRRRAAAWRADYMRATGVARFDRSEFLAWLRERPDHPAHTLAFSEEKLVREDAPEVVRPSFRIAPREEPAAVELSFRVMLPEEPEAVRPSFRMAPREEPKAVRLSFRYRD